MVGNSFYLAVLQLFLKKEVARGFWVRPGTWSVGGGSSSSCESAGLRRLQEWKLKSLCSKVEETQFEGLVFHISKLPVCLPSCLEASPSYCLSKCELTKIRKIAGFTLECLKARSLYFLQNQNTK